MGWMFLLYTLCAFSMHQEGFSSVAPSHEGLRRAWNATASITNFGNFDKQKSEIGDILVISDSAFESSGALIQKLDSKRGLVITNAHAASCPPHKRCRLQIYFSVDGNRIAARSAKVVAEVLEKDIALIEIEMKDVDLAKIPTIEVASVYSSSNSEVVYAIGYPDLAKRKKLDWQTTQPKNSNSRLKRISNGMQVNILSKVKVPAYSFLDGRTFRFEAGPILFHSADTLSGNSGGPIVNEKGKLIAINSGIEFGSEPKHSRYCFQNGSLSLVDLGCSYFAVSYDEFATNFGLALP